MRAWRCSWALSALVGLSVGVQAVQAEAWRFAVMADSQSGGSSYYNENGVSSRVLNEIVGRLPGHDIDFMMAVGDIVEGKPTSSSGMKSELRTWKNLVQPLKEAGIDVYAVRGNHEGIAGFALFYNPESLWKGEFPELPQNGPSGRVGLTYSFDHKDAKIIAVDKYANYGASSEFSKAWVQGQLDSNTQEHVFFFTHEPFYGRNHDDAITGSSRDSYMNMLAQGGVRILHTGHDHQHSRSVITDGNGEVLLTQIISAPAGEKYYSTKDSTDPSRNITIDAQGNRSGYYIYEIDGPIVRIDLWSTQPPTQGPWDWSVTDSYIYSSNGKQFVVAQGNSYTGVADSIAAGNGFVGTTASFLGGHNATGGAEALTTGWIVGQADELAQGQSFVSDVLMVRGMEHSRGTTETDIFTLTMSYDDAGLAAWEEESLFLAWFDVEQALWVNAIEGNFGGVDAFVLGAWDTGYGLGTWGVDTVSNVVWAVLNHNSDFAVILQAGSPVPEPATLGFMAMAVLAVAASHRRRQAA